MATLEEETATDEAAIVTTALDYFEGWFDDRWTLNETTAEWILGATAEHLGKSRDLPDREIAVDVVDVYGDVASAFVRSAIYREYLHLVRTRDGWKIVNALWAWA